MKLTDLIDYLVEVRSEHGELEVSTQTSNGVYAAKPELAKVLAFIEDGKACNWSQESIKQVKHQVASEAALYQDVWNGLTEENRQDWGSWDNYLNHMYKWNEARSKFLERWDAAPFQVVF